jgi:hypothetical protein
MPFAFGPPSLPPRTGGTCSAHPPAPTAPVQSPEPHPFPLMVSVRDASKYPPAKPAGKRTYIDMPRSGAGRNRCPTWRRNKPRDNSGMAPTRTASRRKRVSERTCHATPNNPAHSFRSVAASRSKRSISDAIAAAKVASEASQPSFLNLCLGCCSVSDETFPFRRSR